MIMKDNDLEFANFFLLFIGPHFFFAHVLQCSLYNHFTQKPDYCSSTACNHKVNEDFFHVRGKSGTGDKKISGKKSTMILEFFKVHLSCSFCNSKDTYKCTHKMCMLRCCSCTGLNVCSMCGSLFCELHYLQINSAGCAACQ